MKTNLYRTDNNVERLISGRNTLFLDQKEFNDIKHKIRNIKYNIYYPYKDSEKIILYEDKIPQVTLFKINSFNKLRHQDILGSILSLNISSNYLGDIIIDNDNYYFFILSELKYYIIDNLISIGNNGITLEEIDIDYLKDYERKYEEYELIVTSLRIDNVLSRIIGTSRDQIIENIKNKEVIVNYEILSKASYVLKENDVFSVRRFGKFKYIQVINNTKKGNYVIKYLKYI